MSSLIFSYNSLLSTPDMAKHILVLEIEIRKSHKEIYLVYDEIEF